jgi:hypothetical protein
VHTYKNVDGEVFTSGCHTYLRISYSGGKYELTCIVPCIPWAERRPANKCIHIHKKYLREYQKKVSEKMQQTIEIYHDTKI